jgi:hypothetical protein
VLRKWPAANKMAFDEWQIWHYVDTANGRWKTAMVTSEWQMADGKRRVVSTRLVAG